MWIGRNIVSFHKVNNKSISGSAEIIKSPEKFDLSRHIFQLQRPTNLKGNIWTDILAFARIFLHCHTS